jgi:hypothetical protein
MNLTDQDINKLNDFTGFLSFITTWQAKKFFNCPNKTVGLFTGNQAMKTATTAYGYVLRVMGQHPVPKKNIVYFECKDRMRAKNAKPDTEDWKFREGYLKKHKSLDSATFIHKELPDKCPECGGEVIQHVRGSRVFRFCSDSLPGESSNSAQTGESAEVKNTQYPEFKKWCPPFLIKKDITHRRPTMILKDIFGGADIIIEFVSYNQSVQSTAGQQRVSCWLDEQAPPAFYEEQRPRLLKEDGDFVISCTPADRISYLYDEVFEKARIYYRTKAIANKFKCPQVEETGSPNDIAVIQAATDDNPVLSKDDIDALMDEWADDPDRLDIRRYGIFKQVSGRIYKLFDWKVHLIQEEDWQRYFPQGIPMSYNHFDGIDYHESVNWACGICSISPTNELFIWDEFNPSPEDMITFEIARVLASKRGEYKFKLDLIDPLAEKRQSNTGLTVREDLNRAFLMYKREGLCRSAYWQSWDTKSTRGRDEIKKRIKNSMKFGKPFNNKVPNKRGGYDYLPTVWIRAKCKETAKSFKNWRLQEWAINSENATKERKEQPQQKYSHFPIVYECLAKSPSFRPPVTDKWGETKDYKRFQGSRAYAQF